MMRGLNAYKQASMNSMTDREMDIIVFKKLIGYLEKAIETGSPVDRNDAIVKNNRLWSLILKANAVDHGTIETEDRLLFARMADNAQRYGIRAILDHNLSLLPLIEVAHSILEGLTAKKEDENKIDA